MSTSLKIALVRRRPQAGLLHHSDRGCQYTSYAYRGQLERFGVVVSKSCKDNWWDNAVMESFFGSLKEGCVGTTVYPSHEHARSALFEYRKFPIKA